MKTRLGVLVLKHGVKVNIFQKKIIHFYFVGITADMEEDRPKFLQSESAYLVLIVSTCSSLPVEVMPHFRYDWLGSLIVLLTGHWNVNLWELKEVPSALGLY